MDLSWCIICDRHSIEDNLYCSTECANKDATTQQDKFYQFPSTPLSPPSSPLLGCYGSDRNNSSYSNNNSHAKHQSFSYIPSPPNSPVLSIMDT